MEVLSNRLSMKDINNGFRIYIEGKEQDDDYLKKICETPPLNSDNIKSYTDSPLVSIIVITYNSGKYVLETLESAKAQQKVTEEEMTVKIIERQKQIELEEKEITRREKQYDSEVKKKADADRYAKEQEALAMKAKEVAEASHKEEIVQSWIDDLKAKNKWFTYEQVKNEMTQLNSTHGGIKLNLTVVKGQLYPKYGKDAVNKVLKELNKGYLIR